MKKKQKEMLLAMSAVIVGLMIFSIVLLNLEARSNEYGLPESSDEKVSHEDVYSTSEDWSLFDESEQSTEKVDAEDALQMLMGISYQNQKEELINLARALPNNTLLAAPWDAQRNANALSFHDRLEYLEEKANDSAQPLSASERIELIEKSIRKKQDRLDILIHLMEKYSTTLDDAQKEGLERVYLEESNAIKKLSGLLASAKK